MLIWCPILKSQQHFASFFELRVPFLKKIVEMNFESSLKVLNRVLFRNTPHSFRRVRIYHIFLIFFFCKRASIAHFFFKALSKIYKKIIRFMSFN